MRNGSTAVLKDSNFKWLVATAAADTAILLLILVPATVRDWNQPDSMLRLVLATVLPVVVLFLVHLIPPEGKALMIYWKWRHALPGHEAFTKYAATDPRIDMEALRQAVGPFPTDPEEQNKTWYRLYRKVDTEPSVRDAHRHFLLFRDVAAMSVLLLAAPALLAYGGSRVAALVAALLILCQYAASAIAAQHNAVRFVRNVLAIHSTQETGGGQKIVLAE